MDKNSFEIIAFPLSEYRELSLGHPDADRHRQLAHLQRSVAVGYMANQEAISTARYTMSRFDQELQRLAARVGPWQALTPYQHFRIQQATLTCMVRLGENAVHLNERLMEILLR